MLPRSCSAYSRRRRGSACTRPEGEEDLHVLTLRFTQVHCASESWRAASGGRLPSRGQREPAEVKETPLPRGGPRYSARALPGRASESIEDKLHHDKCRAVSRPRIFRTPHCSTSRPALDATGSQEASDPTWNSRMLWQLEKAAHGNICCLPRA